jgi:hypothetical protein
MKIIFFIISLFAFLNSYGQLGIKISQYRPANELGGVFNKAVAGEISVVQSSFKKKWAIHLGISYTQLKSRQDTVRLYAVSNKGGDYKVYPGYQVYNKYNLFWMSLGVDYYWIKTKKAKLYSGLDVIAGGSAIDYILYYETIRDEDYSGGDGNVGFRIRVGASLNLSDNLEAFTEFTRNMYLDTQYNTYANNEIGVGLRFKRNKRR